MIIINISEVSLKYPRVINTQEFLVVGIFSLGPDSKSFHYSITIYSTLWGVDRLLRLWEKHMIAESPLRDARFKHSRWIAHLGLAYWWVHSAALLRAPFWSAFQWFAISWSRGSSRFGADIKAWIESNTALICSAGDHLSFKMSRQMRPILLLFKDECASVASWRLAI